MRLDSEEAEELGTEAPDDGDSMWPEEEEYQHLFVPQFDDVSYESTQSNHPTFIPKNSDISL
jgi:hypothetical protein